jgi:hypothetical protein
MKTRFFMKLCLFSLLVWCISSCKSDNGDSVRPIALECMYTHLTDMTNMLDTAKIGTSDGTFQMPRTCKKLSKNCKQVFLKVWQATLFYSMK